MHQAISHLSKFDYFLFRKYTIFKIGLSHYQLISVPTKGKKQIILIPEINLKTHFPNSLKMLSTLICHHNNHNNRKNIIANSSLIKEELINLQCNKIKILLHQCNLDILSGILSM